MRPGREQWRGVQHVRVQLEVGGRTAIVRRLWLVGQPAVQQTLLVGPLVARIDVGNEVALVQTFADPREARGTMFGKPPAHSFHRTDTGLLEVSVPLGAGDALDTVRVRVVDTANAGVGAADPGEAAALFDRQRRGLRRLADVTGDALRDHRDWPKLAAALGVTADVGRFEIFTDRRGGFRWRLRRAGGDIVAASDQAFPTREACEAELRWVREHARESRVVSLDVKPPAKPRRPPPRPKRKKG